MTNFHNKMKMMNLQYFYIFMYIWWILKLLEVFFFVESLFIYLFIYLKTLHEHCIYSEQ